MAALADVCIGKRPHVEVDFIVDPCSVRDQAPTRRPAAGHARFNTGGALGDKPGIRDREGATAKVRVRARIEQLLQRRRFEGARDLPEDGECPCVVQLDADAGARRPRAFHSGRRGAKAPVVDTVPSQAAGKADS